MRISVLGVGTELTTGQIINKNAAWISQKLKDLGVLTSLHLTVPDDRQLVLTGLQTCAEHSDIIFVTGGLGPTSDDFTREVVCEWTQTKLEWHEPSWNHVVERLSSRGYPVREFQRQQCFFPTGAQVLPNNQGTANGFQMEAHGKTVFVLPGPPREIEAIWVKSVGPWLIKATQNIDPYFTRSWDTLGYGESEVARLVEEALKGSGLEIGYRVHLPYVEVKVSYSRSKREEAETWINKVDKALQEMTVLRDGQDAANLLCLSLQSFQKAEIYSEVGSGHLFRRLEPNIRDLFAKLTVSFCNHLPKEKLRPEIPSTGLILYVQKTDNNRVKVGMIHAGQKRETVYESPIHSHLMTERRQQYFAEMALLFWHRQIQDL